MVQSQESQSYRLLNVSFLALLVGQVVSIFGDRLNNIALIELLSSRTQRFATAGSTFELSKLALAMTLPSLILGPLAGTLIDRLDRKKVLITTDAARGVLVLVLVATPEFSLWLVYAIVAMLYFANLFFLPARCAVVTEIVKGSHLVKANSMLSIGATVATVAGFAGGGIIAAKLGWRIALAIDAATYLFSAIVLTLIRRCYGLEESPPGKAFSLGTLKTTINLIRGSSRLAVLSPVFMTIAGSIAYVIGVALIEKTYLEGTMYIGFLVGLSGLGMTIGCTLTGRLLRRTTQARTMAAGTLICIAPIAVIGLTTNLIVLGLAILVAGLAAGPVFVTSETTVQQAIPMRRQATVFALRDMLMKGALATSAWIASIAAVALGARQALIVLLALCLVGAIVSLRTRS